MKASRESKAIASIAQRVLGLPTLEPRRSDRLDFHELGIWQIAEALRAAYRVGAASVATSARAEEGTRPAPRKAR